MKIIKAKPPRQKFSQIIRIAIKNLLIVILNCVCLSAYTAIFLFPTYHFANTSFDQISFYWIIIPIIGIVFGIFQIHYLNTGSLCTRTIVMAGICLTVFIVPTVICFII